jgi:hypothetical protein
MLSTLSLVGLVGLVGLDGGPVAVELRRAFAEPVLEVAFLLDIAEPLSHIRGAR